VLLSEIKSEPKLLERNPLLPSGVLLRSGEERGGVEKERERDRSEDALSRCEKDEMKVEADEVAFESLKKDDQVGGMRPV
jgi:hypothetical protein